jgi:hypothetical protein
MQSPSNPSQHPNSPNREFTGNSQNCARKTIFFGQSASQFNALPPNSLRCGIGNFRVKYQGSLSREQEIFQHAPNWPTFARFTARRPVRRLRRRSSVRRQYGAKYDKAVACLTKKSGKRCSPSSTSPPSTACSRRCVIEPWGQREPCRRIRHDRDGGRPGRRRSRRRGNPGVTAAGTLPSSVCGPMTADGSAMAGLVVKHRRHKCSVVLDSGGGYGGAISLRLKDNNIGSMAFNGAASSFARCDPAAAGRLVAKLNAHCCASESNAAAASSRLSIDTACPIAFSFCLTSGVCALAEMPH